MSFARRPAALFAGLALAVTAGPASAALFGLSSNTNSLYSIDAGTGAATLIGATGFNVSLTGLSFADGVLYGTDIFNLPGGLYMATIDTTTGAATGFSDQDGSINWHGLASMESGPLYTIDIDDNNILKSITTGGVVTSIGSGAGIDGRGMAYDDGNGILYATGGSSLYTVDTTTGTSSLIGNMGLNTSYFGLAFDEINGILYGNGADANSLYRIDVTTGAATLIGANGVSDIDGLAWIEMDVPRIPVPAALPLLASGIGALAVMRRRRRAAA